MNIFPFEKLVRRITKENPKRKARIKKNENEANV